MTVELAVTAGPNAGHAFRFAEHSSFIVGRSVQAHFVLPDSDPYVSRFQFLVEVNPPLVRLRDMGSRSGTWINHTKVDQVDLKDGDEIKIGVTIVRVRIDPPTPVESPPPMPRAQGVAQTLDLPSEGESSAFPATAIFSPPGGVPIDLGSQEIPPTLPNPAATPHGFKIVRELGRGGMGVVYEALHPVTGQTVAVKTIHPQIRPSEVALKKFLRETEIVRQLDHPHIVKFVDSGEMEGLIWFAMEFVPGEDAGKIADREFQLPVTRACRLVVQLLDALAFAHTKGFVHRDVKPSNTLVTQVDGMDHVKLADFGLARAYEGSNFSGLTMTGVAGGTPQFMPPEQVKDMRSAKPAADIFSAGATLYRFLAGAYPYPPVVRIEQMLKQILESDPTPIGQHRGGLAPALVTAVHKAMARDPLTRFADASAFAAAIRPFAGM